MFEKFKKVKLTLEELNIENLLDQAVDKILRDKEKNGDVDIRQMLKDLLIESIKKTGEYYNGEEKFIQNLKETIGELNIDDGLKSNILNALITEQEEGKEVLNKDLEEAISDIFRKSPEKKGINFRDKIEDPQELRGLLYLTTGDLRFKSDFEKLLSQKNKIYLRFWPPHIGVGLKKLIPPTPGLKPKIEPGEFFNEIRSFVEDLQLGKDRITLWFEENLLPEELKNDEEQLAKLNIKKSGNIYEFYFTPDKLADILDRWLGTYTEIVKGESAFDQLFKETYALYNDLLKNSPPESKAILRTIGGLLLGLKEVYNEMRETGASKEEFNKIQEGLKQCKELLEKLKPDIERYQKNGDRSIVPRILETTKDFLKVSGSAILISLGLWGLAIGWFLPLWLIAKMDKVISEYLGYKH